MPHEIVQFADTNRQDPTSIGLHWAKVEGGGNLQIHFTRHNFSTPGGCGDDNPPFIDQFSDQLSRDDCNRMIRALRRARDAVYGADA